MFHSKWAKKHNTLLHVFHIRMYTVICPYLLSDFYKGIIDKPSWDHFVSQYADVFRVHKISYIMVKY